MIQNGFSQFLISLDDLHDYSSKIYIYFSMAILINILNKGVRDIIGWLSPFARYVVSPVHHTKGRK